MSESTTNSTASSSDLDNIPLVRLIEHRPPEIQNIEILEYSEITSGFASECQNDEESTAGTVTEEESEVDALATDEVPIDIQCTSDQKPPSSESWPTLQILPGGVIKPSEKDEYPMNIYEDENAGGDNSETDKELMYACAKCPERFKLLYCLVRHVRWHEDQKKREAGLDLSKLTHFERELIFLKRSRTNMEKKYKRKKLDAMGRIAESMIHMDRIIDNF